MSNNITGKIESGELAINVEIIEGGLQGPMGPAGDAGPAGINGIGAYTNWLALGNTGTEAEYLATIKGEKGERGPQGFTGERGPIGPQGPQGDIGPQGLQGIAGKGFSIAATFSSVAAMDGTDLQTNDFVLIDTDDVDDPDNAKLYYWNGSAFHFLTDLSGSQGIQGEQGPQGTQGPQGIQGVEGPQGEAGIVKAVVLTQEEYDVLGDEVLTNDVFYYIKETV